MKKSYRSCFGKDLDAFLQFKRSLGVRYESQEWTLRSFDSFVVKRFNGRRRVDLKVAMEAWFASLSCRPVTITNHFTVLRKFCLFFRRRNPDSFVPDRDWAPRVYRSNHVPYIFTPAEIRILLKETEQMQDRFRAQSYRTLILILYCTGLRIGEAVRLQIRNVDFQDKVLRVEASKSKSRWVPFEETLASTLASYRRKRLRFAQATKDSPFLIQPSGSSFSVVVASNRIRALLRQCGLKPLRGVGPRPYDMRHSFAVNRLTQWYRDGVDLQERLSYLAAYLGHDDLLGTQDYLHLTPELRRIVSARHERYVLGCWEA